MNLGKNILDLRKQKNITQEELAAELGVTAAAVSKWENNYTLPDILMLCALADYFAVTTDELLGRVKQWKYAMIAAETEQLGQQIAAIAKEHGVAASQIFTNFDEAIESAQKDESVRYVLAGFYSGWYEAETGTSVVVSVHGTDEEILNGFRGIFEKYFDKDEHQFIFA